MIIASLIFMTALVLGTFVLVWGRLIHSLGLPVLAAGSFAYLYVGQPASLLEAGVAHWYLSDWQITKALLVCALMYCAFLSGWMGMPTLSRRQSHPERWNYAKLFRRGFLLSCVGASLHFVFMQQSGGPLYFYSGVHGNGAWEEQSAYIYFGKLLVFPGLSMMLIGVLRGRATPFRLGAICVFGSIMLFDAVFTASRGVLFPLLAVFFVTSYLALRKAPATRTVLISGAVACIAVLALVGYRSILHLGEKSGVAPASFAEATFSYMSLDDSEVRYRIAHSEFLITAGVIDAVDKTQQYGFGSQWIYLVTIHLVPRTLWKEKPYGWELGLRYEDLPRIIGWGPTSGAAPSLVGDFYRQFGIFSVLLWFAWGRMARVLFNRAWNTRSPVWQVAYVLLFAFSLHLFAQSLSQLLIFYLYTAVPSLLLTASCRRRFQTNPTVSLVRREMLDKGGVLPARVGRDGASSLRNWNARG